MGDMAKVAYEAYVRAAAGRSLATGELLPQWDELSSKIKSAWDAAAQAVMAEFFGEATAEAEGESDA